ncbi:hypothetical protein M408DRAFT_27028 [Serendipita vermifera MAFF 305830]|uniref:DUF6533 domain-containing protein n=1 Tax=Serendipita vermifera MAFF 305830 TaxID=933852 RepID=A0A0C3AZ95_SERVB|nr:hypothetical protein M408DRAFT_27028 [Serendipita vermifera MAFF 305830]
MSSMDQLITAFDHLSSSRFVSVAGAAWWAHDYLLTFYEEYTRIWPSKWSFVKFLFFLVRYLSVPYIAISFCQFFLPAITIVRSMESISETWLVLIRVRALYAGHTWALRVLFIAFIATHFCTLFFGIYTVADIQSSLTYSPFLRVCTTVMPRFARILYFFQIPLEVILLAMLLLHYWRISRVLAPAKPTPLLLTLYIDGALYFAAIVSLHLFGGSVFLFLDPSYWPMTTLVDFTASSTFTSRMVLRLDKVARRGPLDTFITLGGTGVGGTSPDGRDAAYSMDIRMDGMHEANKRSSRGDGEHVLP